MYSGSNAYLGGSNPQRPGQPSPFAGQQLSHPQQQQPAHQQQSQFATQQTGYMPPQPTGYSAPLQSQFTGYPSQPLAQPQPPLPQSQFQQYAAQQQPQPFQQPVPPQIPHMTQLHVQQNQTSNIAPQPTGMTSAQMADSFRASSSTLPAPTPTRSTASRIPNMRLSFITASDQAKFEQLFKSAVGAGQAMTGDQARELLMRSKLTGDALARIWCVLLKLSCCVLLTKVGL